MYKKYNNISVAISWENSPSKRDLFDGKVIFTDREPLLFFSMNEKHLDEVLKGLNTLDEHRYGTWKKEVSYNGK